MNDEPESDCPAAPACQPLGLEACGLECGHAAAAGKNFKFQIGIGKKSYQ